MARIESLLSARLFLSPRWVDDRIYFVSNLGGRLSLYAMDEDGSVPEPLLPPDLALQNPELMGGYPYVVFSALGKVLVMIDRDGDENYQPMLVPIQGGYPEPAFGSAFEGQRVHCPYVDVEGNLVYLTAESREEAIYTAYRGELGTGGLEVLGRGPYGMFPSGYSADHSRVVLIDHYTFGDNVLYLWTRGASQPALLHGTPLTDRKAGEQPRSSAIEACCFTEKDSGLLFRTALFEDCFGLGFLPLDGDREAKRVAIEGTVHDGAGELTELESLGGNRYLLTYNIDGCSWLYEGAFDEAKLRMQLGEAICGQGALAGGVVEGVHARKDGRGYVLSFSTATSPTQIYRIYRGERRAPAALTREKVLGIDESSLSPGEDASYRSHDGLRISARLYRPSPALGFEGPRPLVYYVHGGPQSQERPNFAWFSIPLIQFLTLNGFAVFVPNARGSTGYGLGYTRRVDRDWGGQDRLDHVHAMREILPRDERLDVSRAAVVGRSYGGYMTLALAGRHPELWSAAVDMFGPFDLLKFEERIPQTWKPYFEIALGHPERDRDFLIERSPRTYLDGLSCPLLVIQGKNDPRVIERESRDLVEHLRSIGKQVDYLLFENEGHDILKHENRVRCYDAITDFFREHLRP